MRALAVAVAVACSGCGATQDMIKYAETARDMAAAAEPCLVAQKQAADERCGDDDVCRAKVREAFAPIAEALDLMHDLWCDISPLSDGC